MEDRIKKSGRPKLADHKVRKKEVTIRLTSDEFEKLSKEHNGFSVNFSVFCREKLLDREAMVLRKPLPDEVKKQMTDLLKMSGSLLLLAKRTTDQALLSEDFLKMSASVKRVVQRADFSVNEYVYGQSLISSLVPLLNKLEKHSARAIKEHKTENINSIVDCLTNIRNLIAPFLKMYNL